MTEKQIINQEVEKALQVLREGGVILYPTDTIWGIGCDATNCEAVQKIYDIKKRADSKSFLVLIENPAQLQIYVDKVPEVAWDLVELADQPLTVIYSNAKNLAPNLLAEDGSVGIRCVKDDFCEALLRRFRKPIVSTSANISGAPSPMCFSDITSEVKEKMDYIINYKQDTAPSSKASSIIKLEENGVFKVLRK